MEEFSKIREIKNCNKTEMCPLLSATFTEEDALLGTDLSETTKAKHVLSCTGTHIGIIED